jgi:hypothetical protein
MIPLLSMSFIIELVIESGQLRGFAFVRNLAICCPFAFQVASACVSFAWSPAFAATRTGSDLVQYLLGR